MTATSINHCPAKTTAAAAYLHVYTPRRSQKLLSSYVTFVTTMSPATARLKSVQRKNRPHFWGPLQAAGILRQLQCGKQNI